MNCGKRCETPNSPMLVRTKQMINNENDEMGYGPDTMLDFILKLIATEWSCPTSI